MSASRESFPVRPGSTSAGNPDRQQVMLLFGGSFDPPTIAHVQLPPLAAKAIAADRLLYIPSGLPPHKQAGRAPAAQRLAMLTLALQEAGLLSPDFLEKSPAKPAAAAAPASRPAPVVEILRDELERAADGRPSYTIDTIDALRLRLGPAVQMRLLIGADQLLIFDTWKEAARIAALAPPVVMVRPPLTGDQVLDQLPKGCDREQWASRLLAVPPLDVSSSEVRRRVAHGQSIAGLVPASVEKYIAEHRLYQETGVPR